MSATERPGAPRGGGAPGPNHAHAQMTQGGESDVTLIEAGPAAPAAERMSPEGTAGSMPAGPTLELRSRVLEVVVNGDPIVKITHTPDGRACPWRVNAEPPKGLGAPADRELYGLFVGETAAIQAAQALAGRLYAAREFLRQANQKVREAREGLRAAEKSAEKSADQPAEAVSADA